MIPYRDILDPVVGPLTHIEVGHMGGNLLAWAGLDDAGTVQSGTVSMDVDIGEDERSITMGWRAEVDETSKV